MNNSMLTGNLDKVKNFRETNNLTQKIQKYLDISIRAKVIESLTKTSHQIKVHD